MTSSLNNKPSRWMLYDAAEISSGFTLNPMPKNTGDDVLFLIRSVEQLKTSARDNLSVENASIELREYWKANMGHRRITIPNEGLIFTGHSIEIRAKLTCGYNFRATFIDLFDQAEMHGDEEPGDSSRLSHLRKKVTENRKFEWRAMKNVLELIANNFSRTHPLAIELQKAALMRGYLVEEEVVFSEGEARQRITGKIRVVRFNPNSDSAENLYEPILDAVDLFTFEKDESQSGQDGMNSHIDSTFNILKSALDALVIGQAMASSCASPPPQPKRL